MDWGVFAIFLSMNIVYLQAKNRLHINNINDNIERRNFYDWSKSVILDTPRRPEHLPEAEPILPGHTLLRPAMGMLKSSVKFPHRDYAGAAVYGNINNLGITYGNTDQRILYTNFRKANDLLSQILKVARNLNEHKENSNNPALIIIKTNPTKSKTRNNQYFENKLVEVPEEENNANEISDDLDDLLQNPDDQLHSRRRSKRNRKPLLNYRTSDSSSDSSSASTDFDENPGNPFTLFKNKYKQNWPWKHDMDGDHMNVNPYSPMFNTFDPSGTELFFGRKWWYFNQDDFKPMG